jgi:hypothetical protein
MFYPPEHEFTLPQMYSQLTSVGLDLMQLLKAGHGREIRRDLHSLFSSGKVFRTDELSLGLKEHRFLFSQN